MRTPSRCWNDATNRHERLTRLLAYIRKGGPLLIRACRCVSERRSRASAEVIGQYQSQPRDNHSCHASPRCVRKCVRACVFARLGVCVCRERDHASVRHSCKINYFLRRSLPTGVSRWTLRFPGKKRKTDVGRMEFAVRLVQDFREENENVRSGSAKSSGSKRKPRVPKSTILSAEYPLPLD